MSRSAAILGLLGLLAVLLRMPGIENAPVDIHHVRQSDTASIMRNMARSGVDLLHPRIDWAGPDAGTVESELPLYNALGALGWRGRAPLVGPVHAWPRAISVAGWALGGLALLAWVRRRLQGPAWVYLVLYAFSPLAMAFSRTIQPDALAVGLFLLGLERLDAASDRSSPGVVWVMSLLAAVLLGTAVAMKGTLAFFVLAGVPLLWLRPRMAPVERGVVCAVVAAAIPAVWYWHAPVHLGASGASFGIWGASAHKWSSLSLALQPSTWLAIGGTALLHTLTPLGLPAAVGGLLQCRENRELLPFAAGLAAGGLSVLFVLQGYQLHNYYQLPLVPFASVLAGAGALAFGERLKSDSSRRVALSSLVAVLAAVSLFFGQDFVRGALEVDSRVAVNGIALGTVVKPGRSILVVDRHPQSVLYAADRRGFHRTELSMGELLDLERLGAEYLYLSKTSPSFGEAGFVALLLESRTLVAATTTWNLFELQPPRLGLDESPAAGSGAGDDDDSAGLAGDDDDSASEEEATPGSVRSPSESLP